MTVNNVDVNSLVLQIAIERIEILKDGASSIYGSDAVGGVATDRKPVKETKISTRVPLHSQPSPAGMEKLSTVVWTGRIISPQFHRTDGSRRERCGGQAGGTGSRLSLGRAVEGATAQSRTDRARGSKPRAPRRLRLYYLKHRGVRASGLRPPSPTTGELMTDGVLLSRL